MRLDVPTLFLTTVAVTFMVGVLFLLSWSQTRRERALAIWGIAHLVGSGASCLLGLRGAIPDWVSIGLGNAVMIGAYGLIWTGTRAFEERSARFVPIALAIGLGLELTARSRRREASRYVSRLSGVMLCAVGLILIVFAASWRLLG